MKQSDLPFFFFCSSLWSHWLLLFWTSCVLPHRFQSRSGSLACTLSCLRTVIPKVTSGATPAFSTNRGVHCISVYTAWQPSHFDPRTCSRQTYPQALVAPIRSPLYITAAADSVRTAATRTCIANVAWTSKLFKKKTSRVTTIGN